ncbi:MAG: methionyl-tRNA formyltransferase [Gammaproteobacteria bacterium]|nr:methionyl-tRNA formyltransferase [Gammaproteobacteria bacterium]
MKVAFAGTPEFAQCHLAALLNSQHEVVAVLTQPDRPAGRGRQLQASAVKKLAQQRQLPCYQPQRLDSEVQALLAALNIDLLIVVAYGLILPPALLTIPRLGCINVHASLLPRWRGAAPIQRAIEFGDKESGITIMQMDAGLDSGNILLQEKCKITENETSSTLYNKLAAIGPETLLQAVDNFSSLQPLQQDETQVCYAKKISKKEAKTDWHDSAEQIERRIRAFNPWPVATAQLADKTVRLWQAQALSQQHDTIVGMVLNLCSEGIDVATGSGILRLTHLQLPGAKILSAADLLNSKKSLFKHQRFVIQ